LAAGGELTNTAFVSAGESWAVGNAGSAENANRTLTERFDGSGWSVVPSPNQVTGNNSLNGVSMIPGAGWAVGYSQAGTDQPLAGLAVGGGAVLARPARGPHRKRVFHQRRHPGRWQRVGGRLPDGSRRDAADADRAGLGRDVDAGAEPQ